MGRDRTDNQARTSHRDVIMRPPRVTDVLVMRMHVSLRPRGTGEPRTSERAPGRRGEKNSQRRGGVEEDVQGGGDADAVRVLEHAQSDEREGRAAARGEGPMRHKDGSERGITHLSMR